MLAQTLSSNHVFSTESSDRRISTGKSYEYLCRGVLENLADGILVLTESGQLIYSNSIAQEICAQLNPDASKFNIPEAIWQVLEGLISNRRSLSVQPSFLISEVWVNPSTILRIRVQWLEWQAGNGYILVNLEDRHQANRDRAASEVKQYGLTTREAEIWLLRREGYSYREIAERLYVAINTVKQHLKHIYAKQKAYLDVAE